MKCCIGADADPAVVRAITGTPAKSPGATVREARLHAEEAVVHGDKASIRRGGHLIG